MRRNRLLLLVAVGLAVGFLVVLRLRTRTSSIAEQPPPAPIEERGEPPLQADAEGHYVPGYRFTGEILYSARDSFVWDPGD